MKHNKHEKRSKARGIYLSLYGKIKTALKNHILQAVVASELVKHDDEILHLIVLLFRTLITR
jgi:hypothetical protein